MTQRNVTFLDDDVIDMLDVDDATACSQHCVRRADCTTFVTMPDVDGFVCWLGRGEHPAVPVDFSSSLFTLV
ncbi:hypothetical protein DPMN_168816 [Dreissena polymorpha]|uniref:Apple domain-containing protein n=1 Tax=Dreissena polymorpha TaxID=45954 RepID=A0A9D4J000_DREPO|nr:hypothetical protein DPMN_168816 [Dreissena polymorpha]